MQIAGPAPIYSNTVQKVLSCKSDDELNAVLGEYQKQLLSKSQDAGNNTSKPKSATPRDEHHGNRKQSVACVII
jgi:hypothetical protein